MYQLFEKLAINIIVAKINNLGDDKPYSIEIKYLNNSACQLLGYKPQDLLGKSLDEITVPEISSSFWQNTLNQITKDNPENTLQSLLLSKDNEIIPCIITVSFLSDQNTEKQDLVVFIQKNYAHSKSEQDLSIMRLAIEQSVNAVMITDAKGYIEYVNPKFIELTGFSEQELLGHNPRVLQSGYTSPEHYQAMWEIIVDTGHWQGEIKNQKKNGDIYWVNEHISAIKNNQGEITHYLAIEEDITQHKQVESALIESEQRFQQMAEMTGEWLWEQDPDGYYIYCSIAVKNILGYSSDDILGKQYAELLTPQDKQKHLSNATSFQPFYSLTNYYRHKNGHQIITESTGLPIINTAGKIIKWRGVDRDITARKHFEDALIESEKRIRLIIESALNAIVIIDSYGMITDWNHHAEKMFGWPRNEAIGLRLDELIIPSRLRSAYRKQIDTFLKTGKARIINKLLENIAIRRDGNEFPVEFSLSPLKLRNAYIFSGFIHDITARKRAEHQIRQAQVNLAIAQNEMKIAHQIQASLLPSAPIKTPQFEVTGFCLPADQVGGDYFDYFFRDENCLDMVIADVSGHSVGPALFMVETRSAIRAQLNKSVTPAEMLDILNNALFEDLDNADYFITLFYLQYHHQSRQLTYANAGHPPPLLIRHSENQCTQLDAEGLVLGVRKNVVFEQKRVTIEQGYLILLYTDGLIEAENNHAEFFGIERVCDIVNEHAQQPPGIIIEKLLEQLKQFCQCEVFKDDITLMILKCS